MGEKTSELGPPQEVKSYETDYGFEIKDPDLLWEVAQYLVSDPDFRDGDVIIGVTNNSYVSKLPRLYVDKEQNLCFKLDCTLGTSPEDYTWAKLTANKAKRTHLNNLFKTYVNPEFDFSWKNREIAKGNEVVAWYRYPTFTYQFNDISGMDSQEFLAELREALLLQQIIISEYEDAEGRGTGLGLSRSSGLVVGNPYLYSEGHIDFFMEPKLQRSAIDKWRAQYDRYLMEQIPTVDDARRIFSEMVPKLGDLELENRALRAKLRVPRRSRWMKGGRSSGRCWAREKFESEVETFQGCCKILGIDPEVFENLTDEQARDLVDRQRRFWAKQYHQKGGYSNLMKTANQAADFLRNPENRKAVG